MKTKTMTTLHSRNPIGRPPLRLAFFLLPLALACFALSPTARAVTGQDGGYPNNNTANGAFALQANTTGSYNTANGSQALFSNTTGAGNTANGLDALASNTTG